VQYPDGYARESLYHMDFAARFRTMTSPAVVRLYHSDAPNRLMRPDAASVLAEAADHARSYEALLARHGTALVRWAPSLIVIYRRGLAMYQLLAGERWRGLKTMTELVRAREGGTNTWAVLGLGLLGRGVLAHVLAYRMRKRVPADGWRPTNSESIDVSKAS
jgi:hypothetical protein